MFPVQEGVAPARGFHVVFVLGARGRVAAPVAVHLVQVGFVAGREVGWLFLVQEFNNALAGVAADAGAVAAVLPYEFGLLTSRRLPRGLLCSR